MDKVQLLDAVERFLRNDMSPEEKYHFEEMRVNDPDLDLLVVEHAAFLNQMDHYNDSLHFRAALNEIHNDLSDRGIIALARPSGVVRQLWRRHRRVMAVAASIAGLTTLLVAGMVSYYSRKANTAELQQLSKKFENTERRVNALSAQVASEKIVVDKAPTNVPIKSGGTGFLIDGKGYLVTNAHVVEGSSTVVVQNNKGQEFRAALVNVNPVSDIAILRIEDADFRPLASLPYSLKKSGAELGEQVFTLGYPREEIVYNEGYMSARTGFNGDTLTCQIGVSANPGNSGGPVFNHNGEVIAIINTRQTQVEGVVFAINARNIFSSVDSVMKDSSTNSVKLTTSNTLKGLDRVQQIRKIQDCVFMVKSY